MDKAFVGREESVEVFIQRCSLNNVFGTILQNLQENTCAEVSS